ncbi:Crp/Fnr family transcriptional regulator [Nitratireductor thuwali]|uniref:Cyclic AMP receptor protein n=1 Tax=Nitratireductor thuwali TaxID=2267699 RepID=A0ABY5MFV9_9HYPH|nr:Cyclic AMP receptor protein [Nitratireductor thuwali]
MSQKEDAARAAIWSGELTEGELDRAARGLIERHYPKGSYICHRGDKLDYWTGVAVGLVKISAISAHGKAMTFAGAASGSWFGEGSVLKDEPRKYDLVAIRDTRLAMMQRSTFMWLYENSTGFNRFLVRQLNERMGQFIATIEYDRILHPKARVARNLSWFFNPVLYPRIENEIEISQEELGLLAGVSRQVVNRALKELEEEGLLRSAHGRITVLRPEALSRYDI